MCEILNPKVRVSRRLLSIVFCVVFAASVMAQNAKEIRAIKQKTETKSLQALNQGLKRNAISLKELIAKANQMGIPFKGSLDGKTFQLQGFDKKTGRPVYYITYNADAAIGLSTDKINSSGGIFELDGEGMILHMWDGEGVRRTHQEFGERVVQKDKPTSLHTHSTHVAGTMVASGIDPKAKGMAPKATLHAYEWTEDIQEMIQAASNGAIVSNHSYGNTGGFEYGNYFNGVPGWYWFGSDDDTEYIYYGYYHESDAEKDFISSKAPYYLPVLAAGNSRGGGPSAGMSHYVQIEEEGKKVWKESTKERQKNGGAEGYDCVTHGSLGKNLLVVGAAKKILNGYQTLSDVEAASFSVFGPTDDGRIKPDIIGIGVNIYSTIASGNKDYVDMSGTSMAAPGITASLGLLQEHYKKLYGSNKEVPYMKSATLKALALHTTNEAGNYPGPDYKNGWGLLNVLRAVQTLSQKDKYSFIEEKSLNNSSNSTLNVVASGVEPLVVTIVWDDPAPEQLPEYRLNNRTPVLVNDLDVKVTNGTQTFLPWVLNPDNPSAAATKGDNIVDNVEQVVIESPIKGATYTITVSHKGRLKTNEIKNNKISLVDTDKQEFSMIVTGINNGVSNDLAIASIDIPEAKDYTSTTPINVKVENLSNTVASGAKLKYKLLNADNNNSIVYENEIALENIAADSHIVKTVTIDLSESFVNFLISAEVVYTDDQIESNNKLTAKAYGIIADLTEIDSRYDCSFEDGIERAGWTVQDLDNNNETWGILTSSEYARTGQNMALNFPGSNNQGTNDWLYSNPLKLRANTVYRIVVNARSDKESGNGSEYFNVAFGTQPNNTGMTNTVSADIEVVPGVGYIHNAYTFTPTTTGIYYIGFNQNKDIAENPYGVALDDISIQYAEGKPMPEFNATQRMPSTVEPVMLYSETETTEQDPVSAYKWEFNPNTVTFLDGTADTDEAIMVSFNQETSYDVTLKATNSKGEGVFTKKSYITPVNVAVSAYFASDITSIYAGEVVSFRDLSAGKPEPEQWLWTITPADGVTFINGSSPTHKDPVVQFDKAGKYSVKLQATAATGSTDIFEVQDLIEVKPVYISVNNLQSDFNRTNNTLSLSWDLPYRLPVYIEDFERTEINVLPADFTSIDEDGDNSNWLVAPAYMYKGNRTSFSSAGRKTDVKNWMITGRINKGGEVLTFWRGSYSKENLKVYLISSTVIAGSTPTLDEIKEKGVKIYEAKSQGQNTQSPITHSEVRLDIKQYTGTDIYIAFYHERNKEDYGSETPMAQFLVIDNIEIGYSNATTAQPIISDHIYTAQPRKADADNKSSDTNKGFGYNYGQIKSSETTKQEDTQIPMKINLSYPKLTGYEIVRNGTSVSSITDINNRNYSESITANGTYTYDVYAVYSDGLKSEKQTVVEEIQALGTDVTQENSLQIIPNPSDGVFVIDVPNATPVLKVRVYNMSGNLLFDRDFYTNKINMNLNNFAKGVYSVEITDSNGQIQRSKLLIK